MTVDGGLALAEQIEIGTVQDVDKPFHYWNVLATAGVCFQRLALLCHSEVARSRSRNFWIFPVEVLGRLPKTRVLGTLKRARRSRQKAMTSASFGCAAPGLSSRKAHGVSPHVESGRATTAASMIAGCCVSTSSTSRLEMFSPPEIIISLERSLISIAPSACQTARSPDMHQPSTSVFAVAASFLR